jgi:hypothetical protein
LTYCGSGRAGVRFDAFHRPACARRVHKETNVRHVLFTPGALRSTRRGPAAVMSGDGPRGVRGATASPGGRRGAAGSPSPRRGRSEPRAAGPRAGRFPGHQRPDAPHRRPRGVPPRSGVRARDLRAAQEPARAPLDAGDLGADLRDVQDLPRDAGQVHPPARALHRLDHGVLFRGPAGLCPDEGRDHPPVQFHRHRRELRRRVVRDPRQHVRELARRVRRPEGPAVSDLRDSVERRHEHRDAVSSASRSANRSARRCSGSPAASSPRSPTSAPT